jgi:hypothetical protein
MTRGKQTDIPLDRPGSLHDSSSRQGWSRLHERESKPDPPPLEDGERPHTSGLQDCRTSGSEWDQWTLRLLIRTTLENFKGVHRQCQSSALLDPLIERATREVLTELLTAWLSQSKQLHRKMPPETMAQFMSWTIFGAAVEWSQETTRTAEQMANDVLLMITEGLTHLAPNALPD